MTPGVAGAPEIGSPEVSRSRRAELSPTQYVYYFGRYSDWAIGKYACSMLPLDAVVYAAGPQNGAYCPSSGHGVKVVVRVTQYPSCFLRLRMS